MLLDIVQCAHAYERIRECSGIKNRVALEYRGISRVPRRCR